MKTDGAAVKTDGAGSVAFPMPGPAELADLEAAGVISDRRASVAAPETLARPRSRR